MGKYSFSCANDHIKTPLFIFLLWCLQIFRTLIKGGEKRKWSLIRRVLLPFARICLIRRKTYSWKCFFEKLFYGVWLSWIVKNSLHQMEINNFYSFTNGCQIYYKYYLNKFENSASLSTFDGKKYHQDYHMSLLYNNFR